MSHHSNIQHRRTHNLLLINRLLSQRDATSPFTLILDTLEQPAKPLVREYIRRASAAKSRVVFLAFETTRPPKGAGVHIDEFLPCYKTSTPDQISKNITACLNQLKPTSTGHILLIIDSLHTLNTLSTQPSTAFNLTHFLSALIHPAQSPSTSLIAIYHADIPLPTAHTQPYHPTPLSLLNYLATSIITIHSLATLLADKAAQERSLAAPSYGLDEGHEGVVIGLKPARYTRLLQAAERGIVLELEHRRRSGRGVREWYFMGKKVALLDDHPLFRPRKLEGGEDGLGDGLAGLSFELGLTDRQKVVREGVVLPYFDAQGGAGPGEGGRILYDIGVEDDFDEDEDEI